MLKSFFKKVIDKFFTREIITYLIAGFLTTAVNWACAYLCNDIIGIKLSVITNSIAWVVAVAFAYVINNYWVFQAGNDGFRGELIKIIKFAASRGATGLIEIGGMFLLDDCLELPFWPVKITVSIVVIVLNYVFSKLIVFVKKSRSCDAGNSEKSDRCDD